MFDCSRSADTGSVFQLRVRSLSSSSEWPSAASAPSREAVGQGARSTHGRRAESGRRSDDDELLSSREHARAFSAGERVGHVYYTREEDGSLGGRSRTVMSAVAGDTVSERESSLSPSPFRGKGGKRSGPLKTESRSLDRGREKRPPL